MSLCPLINGFMKILVASLGSSSFKYRLFDMADERVLARRRPSYPAPARSRLLIESGRRPRGDDGQQARDHAAAVRLLSAATLRPKSLALLLKDPSELAAIGFKAVHAKDVTRRAAGGRQGAVGDGEKMRRRCPGPQPAVHRDMPRLLSRGLPEIPLIAAFETGFHESIAPAWNGCTRSRWSGRRSTASGAGAFTASHRAIAGRATGRC